MSCPTARCSPSTCATPTRRLKDAERRMAAHIADVAERERVEVEAKVLACFGR
jgi:hypothetical protein